MWRDDAYLLDMLIAARKIREFTQGYSRDRFRQDELLQNAVMHLVQIIGEAARHVSSSFRQTHPEILWREIIGMRHRLVHDYIHIDVELVWDVVEQDIAKLITQIEPLVPPDRSE